MIIISFYEYAINLIQKESIMPLFDYLCQDCGKTSELLIVGSRMDLTCPECGSARTARVMSPTSTLTGRSGQNLPGPGDTGCCGSGPSQAGCSGPGSCCGKN